ncbi:hypothetical protein [Sulfuracidifex metallicus]|uniref:Uncharacterized protein n=1 Tax=Sulfuracidifex metallicus DSM 6482 = JCM 9184 TaxID=523847 RepID=A0A6A9QW43_SULME|nr:hypothetical protein [Sulfuracidifex metallicus]MUN29923.1 hypothetical protein [Sulfuracidifex metallicus DSM 6482 = JCM 9184]WOE51693.1 hypothetical protein RQ359_001018 [Sulfuracidifex metallicus DSM 6482 = JCM 9184]
MRLQGYDITSILTPETHYVVSQLEPLNGRDLPSFVSMDASMNEIRRITFNERKTSFYAFYKYAVKVKGIGKMESLRGMNRIEIQVRGRHIEMKGFREGKLRAILSVYDVPTLTWSLEEIESFLKGSFGLALKKGDVIEAKNLDFVKDNVRVKIIDVDSWPLPLSQLPGNLTGNLF